MIGQTTPHYRVIEKPGGLEATVSLRTYRNNLEVELRRQLNDAHRRVEPKAISVGARWNALHGRDLTKGRISEIEIR